MVVVIRIVMLMMMMMIMALKGAIRDFYDLLTAPRAVSNTQAQVARTPLFANHVQHIDEK